MKRRNFIDYALKSIALLATGGVVVQVARKASFPARLVREQLPYLTIKEEALQRFTEDLQKYSPPRLQRVLAFTAVSSLFFWGLEIFGRKNELTRLREHLGMLFLLSSDFFETGADETKPLSYRFFFNPHRFPCQNPFARFE